MRISNSEWRNMSQIQKKKILLEAYIQNLEIKFKKTKNEHLGNRILEARFCLELLRERVA